MRSIRRVGALAVAGLLVSAIGSGPAGAATPASYTGSASGFGLKIAVGTVSATEGSSTAKAASDGTSEGVGAGILGQAPSTATAKNPPGETKPEVCQDGALNAVEALIKNVLVIGIACGSSSATGSGLTTTATANGKVASLDVSLQNLGIALPAPVGAAVDTVKAALTTACNALPAALPTTPLPIPVVSPRDACLALVATITTLAQNLLSTKTLGSEFGGSTSGVSISGDAVTSESTASGATIKILPEATLNNIPLGEPLATISIARANAKVVCSLSTGTAVPSFDPAIVRVKLASIIAAGLPALPDLVPKQTLPGGLGEVDVNVSLTDDGSFTVTPGAKVVLFAGLPIQTEIVVGAGSSKVNPDGSATSVADGVKVHALQLAPSPLTGGILANLAHAEAAGACVAATVDAPPPPPEPEAPEIIRELPRTGGPATPWVPMVGLAGLVLAVITRRAVRSH